jgi:2-oxo-4-hydroxy-4-carboxy--5-ureidoimidazoline (OHCU) decarboxylase
VKNITVSVDDQVYHNARVYAAEHQTSVSKLVQEQLAKLSTQESEFDRLQRMQNEYFEKFDRERKNGPYFDASQRMTRDEVHDRTARRMEHEEALRAEAEKNAVR